MGLSIPVSYPFKEDMKVLINHPNYTLPLDGRLMEPVDLPGSEPSWWVEVDFYGYLDVTIYTETDLLDWNLFQFKSQNRCECGADKAGHPGHAFYCAKFTPVGFQQRKV